MRVYLRTFGCRANHYDSEVVRAMLDGGGHTIVAVPDEADIALFNSCAVTAEAQADLRQSVRRAARVNGALRTVVMGCAAAFDRDAVRALPSVTHVVPGADFVSIAAALELPAHTAMLATRAQSTVRAVLRIQDGCDEHCTFCATTVARGPARSRSADALIHEARELSARHSEIVLTGIHIGSWGIEHDSRLSALVDRLLREVADVRFRLSSLEATEVDPPLAELLRSSDACLVPHLHAPLQSGSDRILRRMGRHWYTARSYADAVNALVRDRDIFGVGADVMCGFPGETEADHEATVRLIEELPFTYLHVFPYSPRPGTAATRIGAEVAPPRIEERTADLRALANRKAAAYRARRDGGAADVIVTRGGPRPEGITEDFLTVRVTEPMERGTRLRARLSGTDSGMLAHPERARASSRRYLSPS